MPVSVLPTIHLNGTSAKTLLEQQLDAGNAIVEAIAKLGEACPNGRDFYPQGTGAISTAMREHEDRIARLRSVQTELPAIAEYISNHL